jgi:peptidoglycan-N-acetylglucosamine deacetylase
VYLYFIPKWIQSLFPNRVWSLPNDQKQLFLTFDDGPIPEVTPWVLNQLAASGQKATFFCVGENVALYPDIYARIIADGHAVSNHTYTHKRLTHLDKNEFLKEINDCAQLVDSQLFRPPYGAISRGQVNTLRSLGYRVIMWNVLSSDFDQRLSGETCAERVLKHAKSGSIIVFHDSKKAMPRLEVALPLVLQWMQKTGYQSVTIK